MRFKMIIGVGLVSLLMGLWHKIALAPFRPRGIYISPQGIASWKDSLRQWAPPFTVWKILPPTPKPGYYKWEPKTSFWSLSRRLQRGEQTPIRLTLRNFRTAPELWKFLDQKLAFDSLAFAQAAHHFPWHTLGLDKESFLLAFLPNTYFVYWTLSPEKLFERMGKEYQNFWDTQRIQQAHTLGFTPKEVGILASIVEAESQRLSERPLIASVYINRLRNGMPLQADPTVIFAHGDFSIQRVTKKHLALDSPYNTYKYRGLPPGPICIPSLHSIESVLNYVPSSYLYFCAIPDGSGYHDFSTTYSEHLRKAEKYQKWLNKILR
ncbi:MAG: endolytic transglycosylase MltG [Bacteroidia bacterium]